MATERIDVIVSEKGSRVVKRSLEDIGAGAKSSANAVDLLKRALGGLSAGLAVRELVRLADTYTTIQNRLKQVTNGTAQLAVVTEDLFGIANRTRQSFESTAELYARIGLAAKELGTSQQELLNFTESLNQAVALSGATSIEASNAMIQLSQGLASGALRGDELRSVLEQLPAVADVIAKSLGVTRGQLRQMGTDGKITAGVVLKAFREARGELADNFAKSVPTVGQAFTVLKNNLIELVGEFDTANGISRTLAQTILYLSNNLDTISRVVAALAFVVGVVFAQRALGAAIAGFRALTVAMLANPFGAIAVAITAVIGLLIAFSDKITFGKDNTVTLGDVATVVFRRIGVLLEAVGKVADAVFTLLGFKATEAASATGEAFTAAFEVIAFLFDKISGLAAATVTAIIFAYEGIVPAFKDIFTRAMNGAIQLVEDGVNAIISALSTVTEYTGLGEISKVDLGRINNANAGAGRELGENLASAVNDGFVNNRTLRDGLAGIGEEARQEAGKRIAKDLEAQKALAAANAGLGSPGTPAGGNGLGAGAGGDGKSFDELLRKLQQEGEALKLTNQEREIQQQLLQFETSLKRQLTADERALVQEQLSMNQSLADQAQLFDEINAPAEEYGRKVSALNKLLAAGRVSLEQYGSKLQDVRIAYLDTQTDLASGLERAFLKINKDLGDAAKGIEEVVTNAFKNAEDALVDFVKTGKLDFKSLVDSILSDLIRLTVRQGILAPIAGALGGALSGGGGGGIGGALASGIGSLLGFQDGGDFTVGGAGGIDSQLVAFRATPGEQVIVNKPQNDVQQKDAANGGQTINFYITTPNAESFRQSESQIAARASRLVGRGRRNL